MFQGKFAKMYPNKSVETYQDNPARTFLGNNAEMFQDKNVEMFPGKNANRFQKKNVGAFLVKNAELYPNNNAQTFLAKSVKKNVKISFGAKFAINLITSTNMCKNLFSQFFYLPFGYLLFLYNTNLK